MNVYIYWEGFEYKLIKKLRELMYLHIPNLIFITDKNVKNFVKVFPDSYENLSIAHKADFVRVSVICDYGGIWLDSDTLVMENLDELIKIIEEKDGFFIRENNENICNGVFGSKSNTALMLEWRRQIFEILNNTDSKIGWNDIGSKILKNIDSTLLANYEIFYGLDNMYPVNWPNASKEFLKSPYFNYKKIERKFQPLIILVNSVYKDYENLTEFKCPIEYFLKQSKTKLPKQLTYKEYKDTRKLLDIEILNNKYSNKNPVSIAIIIPHRNRIDQLKKFIKHLKKLKKKNNHTYDIYIIDQNNFDKFNRGLLLNIGYLIAKKNKMYDRYIFHDVDTYPSQLMFNLYFEHIKLNIHFMTPEFDNNKYTFSTFLGGVLGLNEYSIEKTNGFPNTFFGWGKEDCAQYNRLAANNIKVFRPPNNEELKYTYEEHDPPNNSELNAKGKKNTLEDLTNWYKNGIKQLNKFFINYKQLNQTDFFNTYEQNILNFMDCKFIDDLQSIKFESNVLFFKIDYLAVHTPKIDYFLLKNYALEKITSKMEDKGLIQNPKFPMFLSYLEFILDWETIEEKILDTYTMPKKFNNLLNNKEINSIVYNEFKPFLGKNLGKHELSKTIKFIFETYGSFLFYRIRNNMVECAYHIDNSDLKIDWYKNIKYKNESIDNSLVYLMDQSEKNYFTLKNPHYKQVTNCLLTLESTYYFSGPSGTYVKEFTEMINHTISKFKNVPDCDILINKKDFPYFRKDGKYGYAHLINEIITDLPSNIYPIACQSKESINTDILVPSSDEWKIINTTNTAATEWENKKNIALFRGSSSGCSMNLCNNSRLNLAQLSYDKIFGDKIDVKLSNITTSRLKVYNGEIQAIPNIYNHLLGNFMNESQQSEYKYIFNIQGNAQAYRFSTEFRKNSVIFNVKSSYYMWFNNFLENGKNFIEINEDFSNLNEVLDDLEDNDFKAKNIASEGKNFYDTYINKDIISDYWYYYFYYSNLLNL